METAEEYIGTEYKKPPTGYKNIDLAKKQFNKLEIAVEECDVDTAALTFSSTRWLENAFYSREIIEEDYNRLMSKIKAQTRRFIENCACSNLRPKS